MSDGDGFYANQEADPNYDALLSSFSEPQDEDTDVDATNVKPTQHNQRKRQSDKAEEDEDDDFFDPKPRKIKVRKRATPPFKPPSPPLQPPPLLIKDEDDDAPPPQPIVVPARKKHPTASTRKALSLSHNVVPHPHGTTRMPMGGGIKFSD
jgi:hypothetical protein